MGIETTDIVLNGFSQVQKEQGDNDKFVSVFNDFVGDGSQYVDHPFIWLELEADATEPNVRCREWLGYRGDRGGWDASVQIRVERCVVASVHGTESFFSEVLVVWVCVAWHYEGAGVAGAPDGIKWVHN